MEISVWNWSDFKSWAHICCAPPKPSAYHIVPPIQTEPNCLMKETSHMFEILDQFGNLFIFCCYWCALIVSQTHWRLTFTVLFWISFLFNDTAQRPQTQCTEWHETWWREVNQLIRVDVAINSFVWKYCICLSLNFDLSNLFVYITAMCQY